MNYFEIINATLIELNYTPVNNFKDLNKIEHKRLMNIINRLNKEICNTNNKFSFRQFSKKLTIFKDRTEYSKNFSGKINKILGQNSIYTYEPDYSKFYTDNPPKNSYSTYGEKLLFSQKDDLVRIFYSTDLFVKNKNDELQQNFVNETDKSIIPENFVEKLFINGVAYNFKQNTAHPKYTHWKQEYELTLKELQSEIKNISNSGLIINGGFRKL